MKKRLRKFLVRLAAAAAAALILVVGFLLWADHACQNATRRRVFHSVAAVPKNDVALLLGTASTVHGRLNLHFKQRINAAVELYRAGKVRQLPVSGDIHIKCYGQPSVSRVPRAPVVLSKISL